MPSDSVSGVEDEEPQMTNHRPERTILTYSMAPTVSITAMNLSAVATLAEVMSAAGVHWACHDQQFSAVTAFALAQLATVGSDVAWRRSAGFRYGAAASANVTAPATCQCRSLIVQMYISETWHNVRRLQLVDHSVGSPRSSRQGAEREHQALQRAGGRALYRIRAKWKNLEPRP